MRITTERSLACMEIWGGSQAADTSASTPGLDLWVYSRPHEGAEGGGDVHYVSLCGGGVITRFILADVSGHGASAAELARPLRDLMRKNINRKSQGRLVNELNRRFAELAKRSRFATAIVATYLTKGSRLTVSNAGHPRPLWYQAASGGWSFLSEREEAETGMANLPWGIDESTAYPQAEVVLGRGDLVLLYTDALTEAADPLGRQLGEAGLLELVRFLDPTDPARLPSALVDCLARHRSGRAADDDLTFLLLHHNAGPAPRLSLAQTLDVFAKVLGLKRV